MSGHSPQTSHLLTVIAVFLCICMSGIFTRSSALPSQISPSSDAETLVSEEISLTVTPVDIPQATPTPSPKVTKAASKNKSKKSFKVSPEASEGNWTSSGSNWMFLVDGNSYTGWLTDTDGKRYYFDENGIMQTGWVDVDGKRYYMDLDGIMQTGDITIGKKSYHLNDDGSLEGYKAKKTSKKKSSKEKNRKNSSSDKTSAVSSTDSDSKKYVALTFDDGPSSFTDRLLDCLEENNAKATFFMVGTEIASFPEEVKRMKELGCELGNHTYDHTDLTTLSSEDISSEIARVDQQLVDLTGQGASVVRPPYGSVNDTVKATIGTPMILWSIDTLDWKTLDSQSTVDEVMNNVQDGSIVLMHDIYSTSVDAAEILIPQLIEDGYELVTIHELASVHGIELQTGITYGDFHNN